MTAMVLGWVATAAPQPQPAPDEIPGHPDPPVSGTRVSIDTPPGSIVIEMMPDLAPRHVERFLELVRQGFYDGTTFHRTLSGFVLQGGDPNSRDEDPANDGYGGIEDARLPLEPSGRPFTRGSVGMARDYRLDGASCQFFITLGRAAHLDGMYTQFARVVRGYEIADLIASEPADVAGHPESPVPMTLRVIDPADVGS